VLFLGWLGLIFIDRDRPRPTASAVPGIKLELATMAVL
jgi:hypothetical protein